MSAKRLQKYAAPTVPITCGFIWEAIEVAHTFEYIRHLIERPELPQLMGLAGHLPPLAILGLGVFWAILRHRRQEPEVEVVRDNGNVIEMIVREKTTTTTEREVIYRRTS